MVIRGWGQCQTCDAYHTLRTGVGIEHYQEHYFDCVVCGSPITIAVKTDPPRAWYEAEDNFTITSGGPTTSHLVNLHPNFAFRISDYHSDKVFVSLEYTMKIVPLAKTTTGRFKNDIAAVFDVPNAKHIWSLVKRVITFTRKQNSDKKIQRLEIQRVGPK